MLVNFVPCIENVTQMGNTGMHVPQAKHWVVIKMGKIYLLPKGQNIQDFDVENIPVKLQHDAGNL